MVLVRWVVLMVARHWIDSNTFVTLLPLFALHSMYRHCNSSASRTALLNGTVLSRSLLFPTIRIWHSDPSPRTSRIY